jgi:hypothetical protein
LIDIITSWLSKRLFIDAFGILVKEYNLAKMPYSSSLTDKEWEIVEQYSSVNDV